MNTKNYSDVEKGIFNQLSDWLESSSLDILVHFHPEMKSFLGELSYNDVKIGILIKMLDTINFNINYSRT